MPHHRRIVLSLHHGAASRSAMRHAAEMARLLDVGLTGIFVEDEAVHGLAAMPFAREFRLPSHDWQPIDPARIAEAFRHEAAAVQRSMDLEARGCGVACAFEVRRGDPFGSVGELLQPADMIVLAEPASAANCGVVHLDLNHGYINLPETEDHQCGANRLVLGCVVRNAAGVMAEVYEPRFWMTPCEHRTRAASTERGSRM